MTDITITPDMIRAVRLRNPELVISRAERLLRATEGNIEAARALFEKGPLALCKRETELRDAANLVAEAEWARSQKRITLERNFFDAVRETGYTPTDEFRLFMMVFLSKVLP